MCVATWWTSERNKSPESPTSEPVFYSLFLATPRDEKQVQGKLANMKPARGISIGFKSRMSHW
jgi:hypothetical protein